MSYSVCHQKMVLTSKQTCFEVVCSRRTARPIRGDIFLSPHNQVKTGVVKEVVAARRKQHLASLQYYCALNALQHRKRVAMMEPMIGFAHGQVGQPFPEAQA